MEKSKKVLVVVPHPDDETLGCGGTILKHVSNGDEVYCIFVTHGNECQTNVLNNLNSKDGLATAYGLKGFFLLDFPPLVLQDISLNILIGKLSDIINNIKPEILYIPNRSDAHSDHRRIFEALIICTKSFRYPFIERILSYEVISETDFAPTLTENAFTPNVFVDITDYMEKKLEIMSIFDTEIMSDPLPRSKSAIQSLARVRGVRAAVMYAEAFMLLYQKL